MKPLRSHIIRFAVVLLICSGFSLYMVQPTQARHSTNAFADWLSTMTTPANSVDLQQELDELRQSNDQLEKIIEKASRIINRNNEEFLISFQGSEVSQQLYQFLLIEWSQFQTDNAMSGIPVQQMAKPLLTLQTEKFPVIGTGWFSVDGIQNTYWKTEQYLISKRIFSLTLVPMVDGIAIGAP